MTTDSQVNDIAMTVAATNIATMSRTSAPQAMALAEKLRKFTGVDFKGGNRRYPCTLQLYVFKDSYLKKLQRNYILNGLKDELYNVYGGMKMTKELWGGLERKYKTEDVGTKKFFVVRFFEFKMIDSKSVVSQVQELKVIIHDLLMKEWWMDSGTTRYVGGNKELFVVFSLAQDEEKIYMANFATVKVERTGKVCLKMTSDKVLTLNNVLRDISDIKATKEMLESKLDMKELGVADVILRIRIHRTPQGLALSQSHYIEKVLDKFKYMAFGIAKTPLDVSFALRKNEVRSEDISRLKEMEVVQLQRSFVEYMDSLFREGFLDAQFSQLQQLQDDSNPDFVVEVVSLFFEDSERLLNDLTMALDQPNVDFKQVDAHVHQLKGSSSSVGAQRVKNCCIPFRNCCEEQNTEAREGNALVADKRNDKGKTRDKPYSRFTCSSSSPGKKNEESFNSYKKSLRGYRCGKTGHINRYYRATESNRTHTEKVIEEEEGWEIYLEAESRAIDALASINLERDCIRSNIIHNVEQEGTDKNQEDTEDVQTGDAVAAIEEIKEVYLEIGHKSLNVKDVEVDSEETVSENQYASDDIIGESIKGDIVDQLDKTKCCLTISENPNAFLGGLNHPTFEKQATKGPQTMEKLRREESRE
ncbi:Histidine-containing phosphotransfer protein 1 [Capsicum annuum]|nr:Histidine-containing phosphotransfer protein 1 [Capsicum annuum]